jgi:CRISPR-associated protein Cas1
MPADGAARPVYVSEPGSYVGKSGGRLVVKRDRVTVAELRLIDVSELCVFGNVQVSTQVVRELMRREAAICWFSTGGWFSGITEGLPSKNVELRRRQVLMDDHARLLAASSMIEGKVRNCRTLLRRNTTDRDREALESLRRLARRAGAAASIAELLGVEGAAARLYFGQLPTMIRAPEGFAFDFGGRNRRPPKDRVNCLLSFTYSLLTKDCVGALRQVGFDPYIGVLHRPRFGRPALALDLAEELRPLLGDSVTLGVINNCEVTRSDFIVRAAGVALTHDGRRKLLRAYERRLDSEITHPVFGYRISWRRIIEVQARLLAAFVMGEVDSYTPMVTR